ncbi:cholecystokinin receptor type A-like [Octopus vulgaris]|uniref:Cholecystokinin receptor type A-like n=1 Tax=Octopus vulgaris TaxID=6645 RepID=A0AA36FB11_OCTVU|nr:cholecystokinin receptor type A-like [Octopus vulgaris]
MNLTGHGILDDNEAEFIDRDLGSNIVYNKTSNYTVKRMHHASFQKEILIPPYIAIFLLAVVGNLLVILTLVQNKRMRTVTNVFLLNLSISDLLLAVFCMPFTLIPVLLRNFIFGATMCVLIRYLQGVSVAVSCFTLVAMSLERYFGICQPLHSRRWQTLSRAYKIITGCWFLAAMVVIPIAIVTRMKSFDKGKTHVCREFWTSKIAEKCYTVFLDMAFLLIPVIIMSGSYGSIMWTLWMGIKMDKKMQDGENQRNQPGNSMRMCVFEGSPSRNSENRPIVTPKRRRYDLQSGQFSLNLFVTIRNETMTQVEHVHKSSKSVRKMSTNIPSHVPQERKTENEEKTNFANRKRRKRRKTQTSSHEVFRGKKKINLWKHTVQNDKFEMLSCTNDFVVNLMCLLTRSSSS